MADKYSSNFIRYYCFNYFIVIQSDFTKNNFDNLYWARCSHTSEIYLPVYQLYRKISPYHLYLHLRAGSYQWITQIMMFICILCSWFLLLLYIGKPLWKLLPINEISYLNLLVLLLLKFEFLRIIIIINLNIYFKI